MNWHKLRVAACGTHHVDEHGQPAYAERFAHVLKFHPPGLAPVRRAGDAWHVLSDGTAAYGTRFTRTFGFYEGMAAVAGAGGWHHIVANGTDAYEARHAWCGNFQQGRCSVRSHDQTYHHITEDGCRVYSNRWRYAGDYRDGVAVVQAADGLSSHINLDGELLHDRWFVDLDVFHKGFARARDGDGWMHVNAGGSPAYLRRFQAVEPFYNGQARVERFDGALEVIGETGATIIQLRPPRRSDFAKLSHDMVGFWRTQTIGAAVKIGIFEGLPATEKEVADQHGLHEDGARRLMRALGELELAVRERDQWTLTSRGELLQANHPLTLADAALEYAGPLTSMWAELPDALRRSSAWKSPDIFGVVAQDISRGEGHHRMLRSYARHDYVELCRHLCLRGDEHVLDAGGGLGTLAQYIVDAHPSVDVTVLERPEVVKMAPPIARVHWRSSSLLEPWQVQVDAVILSRVLHDWDDEDALQILRHARASLSVGGRIYLVEMLVSDQNVAGALSDLHLLMVTGGRERTTEHYERLLSAASFDLAGVRRLPALPSVVVGIAS